MESNDLKKFTEDFFSKLNCAVSWENDIMTIKNVPSDFEKYFGKKSPYLISFDPANENENYEIIIRGSFLLKTMISYLEGRGQTTVIKINFNSPDKIISNFNFKDCQILKTSKKEENQSIVRFTFQTTFQYLNEKEQLINSIFIKEGKIIILDLSKYDSIEGEKSKADVTHIKEYYLLAKNSLKSLIESKILELGKILDGKLVQEMDRVKLHYSHQIKEIDDHTNRIKNNIEETEKQISKNPENTLLIKKIENLKNSLNLPEVQENKIKLVKEEEFFINDEKQKHSLNINNKLINTSIIYYPLFIFKIFVKNKLAGRDIELKYNPITNEISEIFCDSCKLGIKEISICSSGHISCPNCLKKCGECGNSICSSCLIKNCDYCGKKLCKSCFRRCLGCGKNLCKSHIKKLSNGKELCISCVERCISCGNYIEKNSLRNCPSCHSKFCNICYPLNIIKNTFCKNCSVKCLSCSNFYPKLSFTRCIGCSARSCNYPGKCLTCRKQLCIRLKR